MKLSRSRVIVYGLVLAAVVAAAAMPQVLGTRVSHALITLQGANRNWLALAMLGFAAGFMSCVCAWRVALAASGARISLAARHGKPGRRSARQHVHPGTSRRRRQDRALLARDRRPGPGLDGGRDVRRRRGGALSVDRSARGRRLAHGCPAALAGVRPLRRGRRRRIARALVTAVAPLSPARAPARRFRRTRALAPVRSAGARLVGGGRPEPPRGRRGTLGRARPAPPAARGIGDLSRARPRRDRAAHARERGNRQRSRRCCAAEPRNRRHRCTRRGDRDPGARDAGLALRPVAPARSTSRGSTRLAGRWAIRVAAIGLSLGAIAALLGTFMLDLVSTGSAIRSRNAGALRGQLARCLRHAVRGRSGWSADCAGAARRARLRRR